MTEKTKEVLFKFQHVVAGLVFLTGFGIHATALIMGREKFLAHVFTPLFDSIFAIPMAFAGIAGIILRNNILFDKAWKKITYWIGTLYIVASIPFHAQTIFTHNIHYVDMFPVAFSYFIMPVMLFFSFFFLTQLKFKREKLAQW